MFPFFNFDFMIVPKSLSRKFKIRNLSFHISRILLLLLLAVNFQYGESSSFSNSEDKETFCSDTSNSDKCTGKDFITTNTLHVGEGNRNSRILPLRKPSSPTKLLDSLFSQRVFNTTMNFIVPGATLALPHNDKEGSVIHLAMQAFFGIFWAVAWISTIAAPVALTYFQPFGIGRSFDNPNDFHLKWKLNDKLAEGIGLNWTSCIQKTICQAHQPAKAHKYGVLGKMIRFLFPTSANIPTLPLSSAQFHEAAEHGAIGQNCNRIYKCFFDVLDVIFYVKNHCFATYPP